MPAVIYCPYSIARPLIQQADFLLWRYTKGPFGRLINRHAPAETPYVHFGMAVLAGYPGGPIHSVDIELFRGGQRRRLSHDVESFPGKIDVWRIAPGGPRWDADAVAAEMERIIDKPYGWRTCVAGCLRACKWFPFLNPLPDERLDIDIKPVCSQAGAIACRVSGRDPLPPNEPVTVPWHFAQNGFANYQFTLI